MKLIKMAILKKNRNNNSILSNTFKRLMPVLDNDFHEI